MVNNRQHNLKNHYETLGIPSSATLAEIRRAYRILARRYHPDVNPGAASEERFKAIADAYRVLSDEVKRQEFDQTLADEMKSAFERGHEAYQQAIRNAAAKDRARRRFEQAKAQARTNRSAAAARPSPRPAPQSSGFLADVSRIGLRGLTQVRRLFAVERSGSPRSPSATPRSGRLLSIVEVSVTVAEAVRGVRKSVELEHESGTRKVSVRIPPGSRDGAVLRTRSKHGDEELVVITRVAPHPFLSLERKGLICEVPVTVQEALLGAQITVPTLDEPIVLKVPPESQSGTELRLKGRGVAYENGARGDLLYRLMIHVPASAHATGIAECSQRLAAYYSDSVRKGLPGQIP